MVTLTTAHDYVVLFAIAAGFGALGGIAYELTRTWNPNGRLLFPSVNRWRYVDAGFVGSVFLGAAAAIAISYFFTPEMQVKAVVHGKAVIETKWQIVKVIPLSLIVGSSGGAFLEAMRSRVLSELNAHKLATTQKVSKAAVDQVAHLAKTSTQDLAFGTAQNIASHSRRTLGDIAPENLTFSMLASHETNVNEAARSLLDANAAATAAAIDASVETAYRSIDAAAGS